MLYIFLFFRILQLGIIFQEMPMDDAGAHIHQECPMVQHTQESIKTPQRLGFCLEVSQHSWRLWPSGSLARLMSHLDFMLALWWCINCMLNFTRPTLRETEFHWRRQTNLFMELGKTHLFISSDTSRFSFQWKVTTFSNRFSLRKVIISPPIYR